MSRGRPSAGRRPSGGVAYATALALMLGGLFATLADVKVAAYALVAGLVTQLGTLVISRPAR